MKNSMAAPQKIKKNYHIYNPAFSLLEICPKQMKPLTKKDICTLCSKKHYLQQSRHKSNPHVHQNLWMDKEVVLRVCVCVCVCVWLPWWLSGEESICQCRKHGIDPWLRKIPWRRKWLPTPVLLPGKSHGQRSLVGSLWSLKESDTTLGLNPE